MKNSPLVTIYIPTKNRCKSLRVAIDSCLKQTYSNIEIIVCDDASTDDTQKLLQEYSLKFDNFKFFRNEVSKGACFSRNRCIFAASGIFVTGLDDDDYFKEDRIEKFVAQWDDKYSFLCANFSNQYSDSRSLIQYPVRNKILDLENLMFYNSASNQIFTYKTRLLEAGLFDVKRKKLQDWDLWQRVCSRYGNFFRDGDVSYVMNHDNSIERVSNNQSFLQAYRNLYLINKKLFNQKQRKNILLNYLFFVKRKKDVLSCLDFIFRKKWGIFLTVQFFYKKICEKINP
ncbi:glycosyltransferase family 2 protein [Comamonas jiangduensis]|uniref:glycosyltransferase family 2 protein n=1 Tax=Comamonas jiangduensis TaxID=1194168 RepID=UPI0024E0860A|nr:glycosyltransferase [Comamonas jiangduensis]